MSGCMCEYVYVCVSVYVLCVRVCICKQSNLIIVTTFIYLKDHDEAKMWEIFKYSFIYTVWASVCAQVCVGVLLALSLHLFVWSRVSPWMQAHIFLAVLQVSKRQQSPFLTSSCKLVLQVFAICPPVTQQWDQRSAPQAYDVSALTHWAISQLLTYSLPGFPESDSYVNSPVLPWS